MSEKLNILVVCKDSQHSKESKVCESIKDKDICFNYSWKNTLKRSDLDNIDLVVSIGGDGTALSASHYLFERPLLAVNSAPNTSEGALTTIGLNNLKEKILQVKEGDHKIERLERIEVFINGKPKAPIALNEVFIANEKAYHTSKYRVKFKRGGKIEEELQISSGLLFSTGTGSTAWYKSAGGEPFSPQSRHIKMIVREPYIRNLHKFKLLKKTIEEDEEVIIMPLTRMILAIDSIREFKLKPSDKIKIKTSRYPLLRVN